MTDWSWEVKERAEQKESFESFRRDKSGFSSDEQKRIRFEQREKKVRTFMTYTLLFINISSSRNMNNNMELENSILLLLFPCRCMIKEKMR